MIIGPMTNRLSIPQLAKYTFPGILVLFLGIVASLILGRNQAPGGEVILRALLRFFRIAIVLCIPLCFLLPIYRSVIEWKRHVLIWVASNGGPTIHPIKHWLFRPFQGIGIGFLFRSKLLAVLQLVTGPSISPTLVIPRGNIEIRSFLLISAVTIFVALLLSVLWTLDDMGIRYFNRRDQELKMVGKYVGTLMPIVFGTYGILGLMANYPATQALLAIFRAVVILYPPFVLFAVVHAYAVTNRKAFVTMRNTIEQGAICFQSPPSSGGPFKTSGP